MEYLIGASVMVVLYFIWLVIRHFTKPKLIAGVSFAECEPLGDQMQRVMQNFEEKNSARSAAFEQKAQAYQELNTKALGVLVNAIKDTPAKTLQTIQGSINNTTGKLGEMIQFIELQRLYDRFIVVGDIVDFLGIKLDGENPSIDFIDIKTGKSAALSSDQKKLRDLIMTNPGCIGFKTVKVQIT